jgi:hypothetical protein
MKKILFFLMTVPMLLAFISCANTENELVINADGTYTCEAVTFELPSGWELDDAQDENGKDSGTVAEFSRESGNFGSLDLSVISFDDMLERQAIYASGLDGRAAVSNYESNAVIIENGSGFLDTFLISDNTGNGTSLAHTDLYVVLDDNKVCAFKWVELPDNSVDDFSYFYNSIKIND